MATRVIFRMFEGEVIALFPEIPGDSNPYATCQSYEHVGQHGAASVELTGRGTKPATPEQYAPLLAELKRVGYDDLVLAKRATKYDLAQRVKACRHLP